MRTFAILIGFFVLSGLICLISCSSPGSAYKEYRVYPVQRNIEVQRGGSVVLALKIEIPDKSHIYANPMGPGIGKPLIVDLTQKTGFVSWKIHYLPGHRINQEGGSYVLVYEKETYVFIELKSSLKAANIESLKIKIDSLLCSQDSCMPLSDEISVGVRFVKDGTQAQKLPSDLLDLYAKTVIQDKVLINSGRTRIPFKNALQGPLDQKISMEMDFSPRFIKSSTITGIAQAILFGLIAGFLLNFMPCVLPVVSLKVMAFVQQAREEKAVQFRHGICFSGGILFSFFILASLAAFLGSNWGSLFQNQIFIILMTALVFSMALSLFGVFTFNISVPGPALAGQENRYLGSFLRGVFATLLATPCSGPFLGGTLAWAFTQPALSIFIIFISVGIGMALPYIIIPLRPGLIRFMPKPGPWMKTFEQLMGFLLVFTTVYLMTILPESLFLPVSGFLSIVAFALWQYGIYGKPERSRFSRNLSRLMLVMILSGAYLFCFNQERLPGKGYKAPKSSFSMKQVIDNRRKGVISVVKFTADWCPNCKLVEKLALDREEVSRAMERYGARLIIADITRENTEAQKFLSKLGSVSIPFLAVLPAGQGFNKPFCLRDIYSKEDVLDALKRAADENNLKIK